MQQHLDTYFWKYLYWKKEQVQMSIWRGMCMHATANEKAWVLVSEWACKLLTQVETRDATASQKVLSYYRVY